MSQAQYEYEVMRELEEQEHAQIIKAIDEAIYRRSIATKWPSVLLWPGKEKEVAPAFSEATAMDSRR